MPRGFTLDEYEALCTEPIQPVTEFLQIASRFRPAKMAEDVPLSTCLYPHFVAEESGVRTMQGKHRRSGKRWAYGQTWDGVTDHYFLSEADLLRLPPKQPLHVTTAQYFDFTYNTQALYESVMRSRHGRKAEREGFRVEEIALDHTVLYDIFLDAGSGMDLWPSYYRRYKELLSALPALSLPVRVFGLFFQNELVGYQECWIEDQCMFVAAIWVRQRFRSGSRLLLAISGMEIGKPTVNHSDAVGLPSLARFKFDLRPSRLLAYYNVLSYEEGHDWLRTDV